jgi:hypothetical protein
MVWILNAFGVAAHPAPLWSRWAIGPTIAIVLVAFVQYIREKM